MYRKLCRTQGRTKSYRVFWRVKVKAVRYDASSIHIKGAMGATGEIHGTGESEAIEPSRSQR